MRTSPFLCLALFAGGLLLSGCGNTKPSTVEPDYTGMPGPGGGSVLGDNGLVLGTSKTSRGDGSGGAGSALGVNAYLWRGALDTLSFMPLASADPFGGVIISDWYASPDVPTERFKLTVYILDQQLRADAVKVAVFRQTRDVSGSWTDAPVDPKTAIDLENAILTRARQLRLDTAAVR
jgi:hypothetical protein